MYIYHILHIFTADKIKHNLQYPFHWKVHKKHKKKSGNGNFIYEVDDAAAFSENKKPITIKIFKICPYYFTNTDDAKNVISI